MSQYGEARHDASQQPEFNRMAQEAAVVSRMSPIARLNELVNEISCRQSDIDLVTVDIAKWCGARLPVIQHDSEKQPQIGNVLDDLTFSYSKHLSALHAHFNMLMALGDRLDFRRNNNKDVY